MTKRLILCICALWILGAALGLSEGEKSRLPGPCEMTAGQKMRVLANGSLAPSPVLDAALSLLEEGNPFLERYNLLTGSDIQPRMPYGVPYLYGGQTESHVFAKAPEYVVQAAWISSPIYYRAGTVYLYGFDCAGYVKWVWRQAGLGGLPGAQDMLNDVSRAVFHSVSREMPDFSELARYLRPGDLLVTESHMAIFLGTLRQFGYTAEEAPGLAPWLDHPLVIHSTVHAGVADHFAYLIANGLQKYKLATVTDGGVGVSILGVPTASAPGHVFQQKQDTWYFDLPDHTWLTLLPWHAGQRYCWYR
ncbi:MAG: C40 family peptidase [Clostridia bacterium]|nr:C40 family peptidase [Clostridia bacterium]